MLIEVDCDAFKKNRPTPIRFEPGLNIVLGLTKNDNNPNSIGKSTMLMILDFVFGGTDYLRLSKDALDEVGPHEFRFAFKFGDTIRRFTRSTDNSNTVRALDPHTDQWYEMPLEEFNALLARQYGIAELGITWRTAVSGSSRIWQRKNYETNLPLSTFRSDTHKQGILRLLGLFDKYIPLQEALQIEAESRNALEGAKAATKHYDLVVAKDAKEVEANLARIEALEAERDLLRVASSEGQESQLSAQEAAQLAEIRRAKTGLLRRRTRLMNQLRALESGNTLSEEYKGRTRFDGLAEFFPEADLAHIKEIESFHRNIKKLLTKQIKETSEEIHEQVKALNAELACLDEKQTSITTAPTPGIKALDAYHAIQSEIGRLIAANRHYQTREKFQAELKQAEQHLKEDSASLLASVQKTMNTEMAKIDGFLTNEKRTAPELTLKEIDKYGFQIVNDSGTGSGYRGLITFDIALLENSALPVIIHDSFMITNIEKATVERILQRYASITNKQVFISIDEIDRYHDDIQQLITEHTRIELGEGEEALFGREWGTK
ncbi:DUF2326 domain-containing protein [Dermabacteraceae bacterium P13138]